MKSESLSFRDRFGILLEKRPRGVGEQGYVMLYGKSQVKAMKSSGGSICSLPIILVLIGCGGAMRPVGLEDLRHLDPVVKIRAIKWAGQNKIEQVVGEFS